MLPPLERGGKERGEEGKFGAAAALRMATAMMTKIAKDNRSILDRIVTILYGSLRRLVLLSIQRSAIVFLSCDDYFLWCDGIDES